jgi:inner membrane protein
VNIKGAGAAAVPWLLVALVRGLDRADPAGMSMLEVGARDEPAHLATSLLVLLALAGPARMRRHRKATATVCASSVLIDVDHLPLYVDFPVDVAVADGRPFTHSLSTVGALAGLAAAAPRHRSLLASASAGVGLHFVRDIATGPGLPLWWPWEQRNRNLPYQLYSRTLMGLAAVGSVRIYRWASS